MSELALEELSAVAAIYCGQGECEVLHVSETEGISFRIQTSVKGPLETDVLLKLLFSLPVSYPSTLPNISVYSEQLTRTQCMAVKERLLEEAKRHFSQPMVHELILWIQENLKYIVEQDETSACSARSTLSTKATTDNGVSTVLLHLDHMRAKEKYVKTVGKWCADLRITGRVMFMGKMIFILLQGDKSSIKDAVGRSSFLGLKESVQLQDSINLPLIARGQLMKTMSRTEETETFLLDRGEESSETLQITEFF
ncbi:RWD domain-containing protein 3 isoform X2 [Paroedura picta]|uniref:RWD domain-containing protein 3 isoform X2 n=1 Tax=Paroedura picta TaxID=143630 RepID=UPI0040576C3F